MTPKDNKPKRDKILFALKILATCFALNYHFRGLFSEKVICEIFLNGLMKRRVWQYLPSGENEIRSLTIPGTCLCSGFSGVPRKSPDDSKSRLTG